MDSPLIQSVQTPALVRWYFNTKGHLHGRARIFVHPSAATGLQKVLGPVQLWGIAVGLVISSEYFGWSYGWNTVGTLGFLVGTVLVATMYTTFIFSFTELSTAIPYAGGLFAYARQAFGPKGGFIAGFATLLEFVFAPPAIALAAYVVFIALNWVGVGIEAAFELIVTLLAIFELLMFMGVVSPGWTMANFVAHD